MSNIDWELLNEAYDSYEYYTEGFLPNKGTILDQPTFFITASKMVKSAIKKAERERYEESKS